MNEPLIVVENLRFAYPLHRETLCGLHLCLHPSERLGLMGDNGSGKSTLLRLLVGLNTPDAGTIRILGRDCRGEADFIEIRKEVGLVFQNSDDQLFCPTVLDDVAFGPLNLGCSPAVARERSQEALETVGLRGFDERITYKLSGGEKRLVAIASILAMHPKILLLDEPTTGLDRHAKARISEVLLSLPLAMILVSHEHDFMHCIVDRCILLDEGTIAETHDGGLIEHAH